MCVAPYQQGTGGVYGSNITLSLTLAFLILGLKAFLNHMLYSGIILVCFETAEFENKNCFQSECSVAFFVLLPDLVPAGFLSLTPTSSKHVKDIVVIT